MVQKIEDGVNVINSIQRGDIIFTDSEATKDVVINEVVISKCIVFIDSPIAGFYSSNTFIPTGFYGFRFKNSTTLTVNRSHYSGSITMLYQIVEFI
jgi:hypothetical protein